MKTHVGEHDVRRVGEGVRGRRPPVGASLEGGHRRLGARRGEVPHLRGQHLSLSLPEI